ncbi:13983_t:CDS:2 [Dentiscutata heterogama]|uniref:13983_t:CDS:1 n=1 Tax=Dentiscutata heterogama TaxID=1316150 RepID=A0ACA9JZ02_9GLOM|nr:13983_t:CDS:2 [Dentiscutata heterogama]
MPFGFCNALGTFQKLMDKILRECNETFAIIYLDDINIYSSLFKDHLEHLKIVFHKLKEAELKLNLEKCTFLKSEINYLGYIINKEKSKTLYLDYKPCHPQIAIY